MDNADMKYALQHLGKVRRDTLEGQVAYIRQASRSLLASELRQLGRDPVFKFHSEEYQAMLIHDLALARGYIKG